MADWRRLKEEQAAAQAEKIAAEFGGGGDFGETSALPPTPPSMGSMLTPFREDSGAYSTPGSIASPREQSFAKAAETREPAAASEYFGLLGSNLAKASDASGLSKLGSEAFGALGDAGESIGTAYRYPGRVAGNVMAGEPAFKSSEFKGAMSDLAAPLRRLAHWNNPLMIPSPKPGQGLSGQTINQSMEALSGPFSNDDGRVKLKPGVSPFDAALMVGGGLGGIASEIMSFPGGLLPKVPNPAELVGAKVAAGAAKLGVPNPTLGQLGSSLLKFDPFGLMRQKPAGVSMFEWASRRGAINMPGKPQLTKEQSDRITRLAMEEAGSNAEKLSDYWTAGALRSRELDSLDDAALRFAMRDFSLKDARSNRPGVSLKSEQVPARESPTALDPDETLGLSDDAAREIVGVPDEVVDSAPRINAPRMEDPEATAARLSRVEKAVKEGGDVDQTMSDMEMLSREKVWDINEELGGTAWRTKNKQRALDETRSLLEARAAEPTQPPTNVAGRQEAKELELAKRAEDAASGKSMYADMSAEQALSVIEGHSGHLGDVKYLKAGDPSLPVNTDQGNQRISLEFEGMERPPFRLDGAYKLTDSLKSITIAAPKSASKELSGVNENAFHKLSGLAKGMSGTDGRFLKTLIQLEKEGWTLEQLPNGVTKWTKPEGYQFPKTGGALFGDVQGPKPWSVAAKNDEEYGFGQSPIIHVPQDYRRMREDLEGVIDITPKTETPTAAGPTAASGDMASAQGVSSGEAAGPAQAGRQGQQGGPVPEGTGGPEVRPGQPGRGQGADPELAAPGLGNGQQVNREKFFGMVEDIQLENPKLASQALKEAGFSEGDYSAWRKRREVETAGPSLADAPPDPQAIPSAGMSRSTAPQKPQGPQGTKISSDSPSQASSPPDPEPFTDYKYGQFRQGVAARTTLDRQKQFSEPSYLTPQGKIEADQGVPLSNDEFVSRILDVRKKGQQAATPLMKEGAKATEAVYDDFDKAIDAGFRELPLGGDKDFAAFAWSTGVDDALARAAGVPLGLRTGNKSMDDHIGIYRKMFDETGNLAHRVLVQEGPQGRHYFQKVPGLSKNRQSLNTDLEWLGKKGDPRYEKLADWIATQPENVQAGVTRDYLDTTFEKVMKSADKHEAMERMREIPVVPDLMHFDEAGKRVSYVINRGPFTMFPSPTNPGGKGINDWHLAQHNRIAMVKNAGTPGANAGGQGQFLDHWSEILEGLNRQSGPRASDQASKALAGLVGNTEMAGWSATAPLGSRSVIGRTFDEAMRFIGRNLVSRNPLLSPLQPSLAVPQYAPGFKAPWVELVKSAVTQPQHLGANILRRFGLKGMAEKMSPAVRDVAAETGIAFEDVHRGVMPQWKNLMSSEAWWKFGGPKYAMRSERPGLEYKFRTRNPIEPLQTVIDSAAEAVAAGNDVNAATAAGREASYYIDRAVKQGISFTDEAKLDQLGISPSSVNELKAAKGGQLRPEFEAEFTNELKSRVMSMTQQRTQGPLDSPPLLNDKTAHLLVKFQRYGMNMMRDTERDLRILQAAWSAPTLSAKQKGGALVEMLNKMAVRAAGAQLQGEVRRQVMNLTGREDTDWEKESPFIGRLAMNMVYASLIGPYALLGDRIAQASGAERPWAKRGGKEEKPMSFEKMLFGPGMTERIFDTAAETAGRAVGLRDDEKGLFAPLAKLGASMPGGEIAGRAIFGNEAVNAARGQPSGGAATLPRRGLFERSPSRPGLFEKKAKKGLFEREPKKRGLFERAQ